MSSKKKWGSQELQLLREKFPTASWPELIGLFGRSKAAIETKAASQGITRAVGRAMPWDKQEEQILRDMYHARLNVREIATRIGRPLSAVYKKAQTLNLQRARITRVRWTASDDDLLKSLHPRMTAHQIASRLGRTVRSVYTRLWKLSIAPEYHRPGRRKLPIGSERMNRGVMERRIATTGCRKADWKRVDVIEWEVQHGPVPEGHVLVNAHGAERSAATLTLKRIEDVPVVAANLLATPQERALNNLKAQFGQELRRIERSHGIGPATTESTSLWSERETAFLLTNRNRMGRAEIAAALHRSPKAVSHRLTRLGLPPMSSRRGTVSAWTSSETSLVRLLYSTTDTAELARRLGRTRRAVERQAHGMKLRKAKR